MIRRPYSEKTKYDTLMCNATHCTNVSVRLDYVENRLLLTLEKWLNNHKLKIENQQIENYTAEINVIQNRLSKLDSELADAVNMIQAIYEFHENVSIHLMSL